jgi:hypothetical protein
MAGKTHGRPRKKSRNITGLRNQEQYASSKSPVSEVSIGLSGQQELDEHEPDQDETITAVFDGLKINFEQEYGSASTDESEIDEEMELVVLVDEEFGRKLADMIEKQDDKDLDWIPESVTDPH